jgi:uncharacterized protein YcbX
MLKLSGIYVYPIKSLAGVSLTTARVEERGLQHDRRWMLVDPDGRFLSQREWPQMALLDIQLQDEGMRVSHRQCAIDPLLIPWQTVNDAVLPVQIWNDRCEALAVSKAADRWFSTVLGLDCRLVYMPERSHRPADPKYAGAGHLVSFADAFPFLLIGEASLEDLNRRLDRPVPMNRFRPNLVFSGGTAYAEDEWKQLSVGETRFRVVKACARCVLTTVDQDSAERGPEPLRTLATYRKSERGVLFGQNLIREAGDAIRVGDEIRLGTE